nr:molybdenum cofactor guanylyltransferase [Sansalvadorimonas sp. 2012CJ34-2]
MTKKLNNCTGIVLTGGRSSRMGQDKALLAWQNKPLYRHMAELLAATGIQRVFINGVHDFGENIADIFPGRGPLSGLHAALNRVDSGYLLIVPVDMPLLKEVDLVRLIQQCDDEMPLQYEGYSLPLLMPVSEKARQLANQTIQSDNRRNYALWRLMEKLNGQKLPAPEGHETSFCNTNTPQEWRECTDILEVTQTD